LRLGILRIQSKKLVVNSITNHRSQAKIFNKILMTIKVTVVNLIVIKVKVKIIKQANKIMMMQVMKIKIKVNRRMKVKMNNIQINQTLKIKTKTSKKTQILVKMIVMKKIKLKRISNQSRIVLIKAKLLKI